MITLTASDIAQLKREGLIQTKKLSRAEVGSIYGKLGGPARAARLSPERRLEIARIASAAAKAKRDGAHK